MALPVGTVAVALVDAGTMEFATEPSDISILQQQEEKGSNLDDQPKPAPPAPSNNVGSTTTADASSLIVESMLDNEPAVLNNNSNDRSPSPHDYIASFLSRHATYFLGTLFGIAAACLELESAVKYNEDGNGDDDGGDDDDGWINVIATFFYLLSGIAEVWFEWSNLRYCYDWLMVVFFSTAALFDLLSSICADYDYNNKTVIKLSVCFEFLSVALFFLSAIFQIVGHNKRYRFCASLHWSGFVVLVADIFFLAGTSVDWIVFSFDAKGDDISNTEWLHLAIWAGVSAIFWFTNSVISALAELFDKPHQHTHAVGDEHQQYSPNESNRRDTALISSASTEQQSDLPHPHHQ